MHKSLKILAVAMCLTLSFSLGLAKDSADPATPTKLEGGKIVKAEEAKEAIEAGNIEVFDMRKALNFEKGHLKTAVSLPYDQKSELSANFDMSKDKVDISVLPKDKNKAVLFYSDGPTGWKSYKMAVIAIANGYKKVLWFRGGTSEWIEKGLPLE